MFFIKNVEKLNENSAQRIVLRVEQVVKSVYYNLPIKIIISALFYLTEQLMFE